MNRIALGFKALMLALVVTLVGCASTPEPIRTVYHFNAGIPQATAGLRNIANHLNADPSAKIVVVAHGPGIDFLLEGATLQNGQPFSGLVADLANKGVEFKVCNNTLVGRKIDAGRVHMQASIVPSGVAEVARLQSEERFVYLKP